MSQPEGLTEVQALGRIADALFQLAKATRAQVKVAEGHLELTAQMAEAQKANMAVTKQLESILAAQSMGDARGSA